jgi:hypothetical protein
VEHPDPPRPEAAKPAVEPEPAKPAGAKPAAEPNRPAKARPARAKRNLVIAALAGAALVAIVLAYTLRDRTPTGSPRGAVATSGGSARGSAGGAMAAAGGSAAGAKPAAVAAAGSGDVAKPSAPHGPNPYVGSKRCADCHEKEAARWKDSWHARALSPGKRPWLVGDFNNAHFTGTSSEAWMKHVGERYVMRASDVAGKPADFDVSWVIGGKRMQDDVTVMPDGRWQVLPIYFHVTGKGEWVDYTEAKQGALTPEHPFYWTNVRRMANHECLDCHTTGLRVGYDEGTRRWTTTFTDGSVACESCHGAGGRHAESQEERDIVHPVHSGAVGLSACARCHGPRRPLFPMLDPDHQFELGQSYDELYDPIVVVQGDGMSPEFFVDGKPKTSSFEYQAMLQAACFRKGNATCLTCHTAPHDPDHGHAELRGKDPDESCRKCHADVAKAGAEHTHHKAAAAQRCVACHMAPIVSGVLDHFADHSIDVPVPENTVRHGVPSACGVCHADKPAAALATSLTGWWPNARVRQARRLRLADAFDPATGKESARPLLEIINDAEEAPTLRGAAAIVLALRFRAQTAPVLVPLLDSPDVVLRAKGCEALAVSRATSAADALARRLQDPSLRVRLAAALALQDLRDPRGEPALRALAAAPASTNLVIPHFELGRLLARRGDFAGARAELTRVARLAPYFTEALVELAGVSADGGDLAEARARLEQALSLEPHHARARAMRDQIEAAQKGAPAAPAAPAAPPK